MWLLSGAFFPAESASPFIKPLMVINPLTYGMTSLKTAMNGVTDISAFLFQTGVVWLFGLLFVLGSVLLVSKKREVAL